MFYLRIPTLDPALRNYRLDLPKDSQSPKKETDALLSEAAEIDYILRQSLDLRQLGNQWLIWTQAARCFFSNWIGMIGFGGNLGRVGGLINDSLLIP